MHTAPDLDAPTRLWLVRHGTTAHTMCGRISGRGGIDPDLDDNGAEQAARVAAALHREIKEPAVQVVSSSLRRAHTTAQVIAAAVNTDVVCRPAWDEQDMGDWDGLTWSEIKARGADAAAIRCGNTQSAPGGENFAQLCTRVHQDWEEIITAAQSLVIVTHRGPLDALLVKLLGIDRSTAALFDIAPCSITRIRAWRDGGVAIDTLGEKAHLLEH
ncbi:histidine phosphatase family protein [Dermatophilus congolensis]|uniref:Bifunctional RNase H/acid phosphatase n=1 Tax=Dermatophilus congolensis TaxID=1863 RepID=A0A239VLP9_9MICO|nr:histidine phosphatase family protein [Dermatophilus congolensis]MBO3129299.1 histidine phosphatase family protein [Dermatophilus congolensis]MBO3132069.1 histidine phosphatase family protein [Dermatophilus congolensis]MBO3133775.1 histidine phosphatase family protein [Dermatophilus congolensis]MBO3136006.1 histidine phosphatase family protein [Dermatophilus congolensis]MBO3138247.1 histidine phosphatase family protein [Dermatophilus congolensis]